MITVIELKQLKENDGMTLKNGSPVTYKSGYQVATEGQTAHNAQDAYELCASYGFTCGIWLEKGIYYIDKSRHVATKREALELGQACNQISILKWKTMSLIYC